MWCSKKSETFQVLLQLTEVLFCEFSAFSEKLSKLFSDSKQLKKKFSNAIWQKWKNCGKNVMFEENVNLLSFCCSWLELFFVAFRRSVNFSDLIRQKWENCEENMTLEEKNKTFQFLLQLRETFFFVFFGRFVKNHQNDLVSPNSWQRSLVLQFD